MTADPITMIPVKLVEPPLTDGPVPLTVLRTPYCDIEPRSRRVFISRRADAKTNCMLCVGSWEMFAELAMPVARRLFKEYDLGAFMAAFLPQTTAKSVLVAATELPPLFFSAIKSELAALHQFNGAYYQAAQVVGDKFGWLIIPSPVAAVDPLSAPTAVTTDQLEHFLNAGWVVASDRNDSRIAALLDRSDLWSTVVALTDKNVYWQRLQEAIKSRRWIVQERVPNCHIDAFDFLPCEPLHLPPAVLVPTPSVTVLDQLLAQPPQRLAEALCQAIVNGQLPSVGSLRPDVNYFVKATGGASGNGVEPSIARLKGDSATAAQLQKVLMVLRTHVADGAPIAGLQLLEPIDARTPNRGNPCETREYFSPCLISRFSSTGQVMVAQAADQVLKGGTDYCGASYWHRQQESNFLANVGSVALQTLHQVIINSGYVGYFGTDFVQNRRGQYVLVADGNTRMNGNDVSYAVRNALQLAGVTVDSALQYPILLGEVPLAKITDRLAELFGSYRFNLQTGCGVVLSPSLTPTAVAGENNQRKVMAVYCNPAADRDRFDRFWSEHFGG